MAKNAAGELPLGVVSEIGVAKTMISFIRQCPPWDDPAHYVKNFGEVLFSHLGHHDILQYLLTDSQNPQEGCGLKAAINTLNSKGYTLLKHATELSKERAEQTIKLLLSCSADPTIRDGYGKTVLEQAVMSYPGISEEISNIVIQHAKEKGILQKWLENKSELNSLSTRKTVLDERRRHLAEVVRDILQKEPTDRTNDVNELRQDIWLIEQFLSHGAKLSNGWKLIEDPRDPHYKKLGEFLVKARRLLNTLSSPNPVLEDGFVEATRSLWEDLARCGG